MAAATRSRNPAQFRIGFYVQHLMGIGHLRRAAALCRALAARGHAVRCFSGGYPVPNLVLGDASLFQLPPARARDLSYNSLVDLNGDEVDDNWMSRRRRLLISEISAFRPDLMVTESFPFGRRLLRFELDPLLDWVEARRPHVKMAASIRDILDGFPGPEGRMQDVIRRLGRCYQRVLVHGDEHVCRLDETFPAAAQIGDLVRYTGYVSVTESRAVSSANSNEVLVSTGGGVVGYGLAATAIEAANLDLHRRNWRVLIGHNLDDAEHILLQRRAGRNCVVERNRPDFVQLLANAAVSVSQAGYNTMAELLGTSTPAVVVPFVAKRQSEQSLRAELFQRSGRITVVLPDGLTPARLCEAVDEAIATPLTGTPISIGGIARSVEILEELVSC